MPTYPLFGPPVSPATELLKIVNQQSVTTAEWSGHTSVIDKFTTISLDINWPRMSVQQAVLLSAWMDALRGGIGTFLYRPKRNVFAQASTRTLVSTCFAMSSTALLGGWSASAATGLQIGQYISIAGQLHRLETAPTVADSSGHATIEFASPVRLNRPAGTSVEFANPTGTFRRDPGQNGFESGFQIDSDNIAEFPSFSASEAY